MLKQDKNDLKNIHRLMNNTDKLGLRLAWLPLKEDGSYDGEYIEIDIYKPTLRTLLHEYLHHIYPKATEKLVEKRAWRIYDAMTPRQRKYLFKKLELYAEKKYGR